MISHKNIFKIGKYKRTKLNKIKKRDILNIYFFMQRLRICEESLENEYHPADEMRCPVHFCVGQEAVPAVLSQVIKKKDYLFPYRSHGYYLAKKSPMKKLFAEL